MANELFVGIKIGAALAGTFSAAFASVKGTLTQLGQVSDALKEKHARMGEIMARAFSHPTRNVGELRRHYERLGQTIDQLRVKQEKLATSLARGEALKATRADLRGQAMETVGTGVALGAPVMQSIRLAAGFEDQVRDIAITGEFSKAEEAKIGSVIRESALKWNQTQAEIGRGIGVLVAGGVQDAKALESYAPVMAKAATATRASMDDLGSVVIALRDNLKVGEAGFEGALNMLAYAGKRGQFEIRDMAKWLPSLSPGFQALGVTGKEAVAEIGAALQIARKGAGSNDEAANNFRNFLQKITAPDTLKDFQKAGIDLKESMLNLRAKGFTPVQAMLETITLYMGTKGPAAAGDLQRTLAIKDDAEREAALQRLSEAYKLGDLFQDMQAMAFIRPAIANMGEMKDIKQGAMGAADRGLLDIDYKKRVDTATEQFKALKIGLMEVGITIGSVLLPPLVDILNVVRPVVQAFGNWAQAHPGLVKGVIGLVGGLLAGKLAVLGLRYGINLLISPFNAMNTLMASFGAKAVSFKGMALAGQFAPFMRTVGRVQGIVTGLVSRISTLGFVGIGRGLVGGFQAAIPWIGRVAMILLRLTPIGLALSTVGLLVYKYWQPIKGFFVGLWQGISSVAGPAIKGLLQSIVSFGTSVQRLVLSIPGIGFVFRLVGALVAPVLRLIVGGVKTLWQWFTHLIDPVQDVGGEAQNLGRKFGLAIGNIIKAVADLPARFIRLGADIVDGLVSGIQTRIGNAVKAVSELGDAVAGKFKSALGIQSPSRVFMGFGDNIGEGAAIGIDRSAARAAQAVVGMAMAASQAWAVPNLPAPRLGLPELQTPPPIRVPLQRQDVPFAERQAGAGGADRLPAPEPKPLSARAATALSSASDAAPQGQEARRTGSLAMRPAGDQGGITIHFNPSITVQGSAGAEVKGAVMEAAQLSLTELERMIRRVVAQQQRRDN